MKTDRLERVLLVEDNLGDARLLSELFESQSSSEATIVHVETMAEAEAHLARHAVDIVLLDLGLADAQGLESVRRARAAAPRTPLVVLTGEEDEALAMEALKAGAQDYLVKGQLETRRLVRAMHYAMGRNALEERLQESAKEYRLLFEANPHAMWVFDVETLAFLAVNDAAVRLYGYSREEFLAMTIQEIRPEEEVPALLQYLTTIPPTPSLTAVHVKHRRKDGSRIEVAGVSNPIDFRGREARLVMASDISERRRLEAQLSQAMKMEAVGRLAGGIAHDFNNLLGVITGYSELLIESLGSQHPDRISVEQIHGAADRAAGLTRQLLAFSRKQVLQPRVLDLGEVVGGVAEMLRRLIGEDIQLVTTGAAGLGRIRADQGQLEQVLVNLVVNARDAMPMGGRVILEASNAVLDSVDVSTRPGVQAGDFVMLSVSDTGCGMDAQTQEHLFEPFFTTKEPGKGTGLGLATVFGIVQQSGANITVETRPGIGTTFRIYFPRVADELSRQRPGVASTHSPRGSETIVLVEDSDPLRLLVRTMLESSGYIVLEFSDPHEALRRVGSEGGAVRLLLTDVVMPVMSGPDLARRVQLLRPEIRVLFMSGYTDEAMGIHGVLGAGMNFIQKPFPAAALQKKIREVIEQPVAGTWERPADVVSHRRRSG
jgi:two-component system cell cycle sensor histidine kinase/response regulator CckA